MAPRAYSIIEEETLDSVQEKLWSALPSIVKLRVAADAEEFDKSVGSGGGKKDTAANFTSLDMLKEASVPFFDIRHLAECLFMACHTNPVESDLESGVEALLGKSDEKEGTTYTFNDFVQVLRDAESQWLEWHDTELKWRAVTERHHMSVVKELLECVTQDVEPFALLPRHEVLTAHSVVAHTKTLMTPFECFVDFIKPREYPEIYDTLWTLLQADGQGKAKNCDALTVEQFTLFFKWFYLSIFSNATEESAAVAARRVWCEHLNAKGFFTKCNFVAACRRMCQVYGVGTDDVNCLDTLFRSSEAALRESGDCVAAAAATLFERRGDYRIGHKLTDPMLIYAPEELDEVKVEMEPFGVAANVNRIVIYGKRGVGKTALARALAERLNCVHLGIEELALEAVSRVENGEKDALGAQILDFVACDASIPLSLLALLVRRKLCADETLYRGYVFSDFPILREIEDPSGLEFLKDCGLLDVLLPNFLLHLRCDETFYTERSAFALQERQALLLLESQLRRAVEEEEAAEESRRKALMDDVEQLRDAVRRYKEMLEASASATEESDPAHAEVLEAARIAAENAERELPLAIERQKNDEESIPKVSDESLERAAKIKELTLQRIVTQSLAGEECFANEHLFIDLSLFQDILERIRFLDHCLTIGCTSLVEDAVEYVIDTLQLHPCVLPRDVAALYQQKEEGHGATSTVEDDTELAQRFEEAALAQKDIYTSTRWKRFCPVTFAEAGVLVEGTARFGCVFCQRLYYLASAEKLAKFLANPVLYLREMPVDREPILLLSTLQGKDAVKCLSSNDVSELIQSLHQQLHLTPMFFDDFVAQWEKFCSLKEQRDQSLAARQKFEVTERKLRAERLKKRKAKQLKKKKNKTPTPPPKRKKGGHRGARSSVSQVDENVDDGVFKEWEKKNEEHETLASHIESKIVERLSYQKTFVPVLVHAFEEMNVEAFGQLLRERMLPENVVVLEYEQFMEDEDETSASPFDEVDGGDAGGRNSLQLQTPQQIVLGMLEAQSQGDGVDGLTPDPSPPKQTFKINRVSVNGKSVHTIFTEILQRVCPGMAPVQDAVVDETLGEMDDEESGIDVEQEDESRDNEGFEGARVESVNPAVRPGKRFLNQFGSRLQYCPVTLYEKQLLVRGKADLCSQYQHKLYLFASQENKNKFEQNPLRYLEIPPPNVPLRLWIVGYSKSGKQTLAKSLHKMYNVPYFVYNRLFFEQCVEAARKPGGEVINGIHIKEQIGVDQQYLLLAESILRELRDFAEKQEQHIKLREEARAEMRRREEAEERDEEVESDEVDEEAEARLQENLEFESEADEDRDVRLTISYLKLACYVTRIEPFNSQGYIMVCPPFSDGDMELLFAGGTVPEAVVQIELSENVYYDRNKPTVEARFATEVKEEQLHEVASLKAEAFKQLLERRNKQKERELRKWRRRHIGINDPESDSEDDVEEDTRQEEEGEDLMTPENNALVVETLAADRNLEVEALTEFSDAITEHLIEPLVVNGDLSVNAVFRAVTRRLCKALDHRRSFFYVPEVVRYDNAMSLLESGGAILSHFGYNDPVASYDGQNGVMRLCKWMPDGRVLEPEPVLDVPVVASAENGTNEGGRSGASTELGEGGGEAGKTEELVPQELAFGDSLLEDLDDEDMSEYDTEEMEEVINAYKKKKRREWICQCQRVARFCGRLFFFKTDATLFSFLQDPLRFVQGPPPLPRPLSMTVISVYEDESSLSFNKEVIKQRYMANHIAISLNYVFVSFSKLLSWAALHAPLLSLSKRAIHTVLSGTVDDDLVGELLLHRLDAADVRRRGVVLLNLPRTPQQYKLLLERGLRIDKVFSFSDTMYTDLRELMFSTATVDNVDFSSAPNPSSALLEIMDRVGSFVMSESRVAQSRTMGFPVKIDKSYHVRECIAANLSSYQWFCPSSWTLNNHLVDMRGELFYGAMFLGKYYFFSSNSFLENFLLNPADVTVSPGLKSLPNALPSRVPPGTTYSLELSGCCPVTLYDTRENRGLRGLLEPVAKKGDPACIVQYDGRYYAMLDETTLKRFMMSPWQYIGEARLPISYKVPLPLDQSLESIDEETYMRRLLYDPLAYALIAVVEARPMYPGLSLEESALKFIALHMKSSNPRNSAIQAEQYMDNYDTFRKRATLYKTIANVSEAFVHGDEFLQVCTEWEKANDKIFQNLDYMSKVRQRE